MSKEFQKILIVEDHPTMIDGYKSILFSKMSPDHFVIDSAYNCESAFNYISNAVKPYDMVFLDLELPPYEAQRIKSGEELALLIQKKWPDTKILIMTSHVEAFLLYGILKKVNPDALLIKCDFNADELWTAYLKVSQGESYYTLTARKSLSEVGMKHSELDSYDRRIISLLAKGIKTKSIPEHLGISISAVDKRKHKIRLFFDLIKGNDEDIITEARKRGLI